ncbi:MAG: RNA polymerase-binding protein DksA [Methylophilaceae bacterium]|nr:RNA polymerase-binding protein DksA [Methylophilaceae bacterium]
MTNEPLALDEAALLAMPPQDYMNAQQLAFFRQRLEAQRNELIKNLASTGEHLRESEEMADPADRATQEEEHTIELRTRDRERKLLHKVESALNRIERKEYGYCKETGEPIGLRRLLARPTAGLTIEAQERHELRERQLGN